MKATDQDIVDLIVTTVINLDSDVDVRLSGDNVLVGSTPVPMVSVKAACKHSAKAFLSLIKRAL